MYKIYVNDTKIVLLPSKNISVAWLEDDENLVARYTGKVGHLLNFIDMCEKSNRFKSIRIHSENFEKLLTDFEGLFKVVEAAGGLVKNEHDQLLFIHRRGSWDLPKGKIESGETKKEAAVREVMEETGLNGVSLGKKIANTRHAFRNKSKKRCIKLTYWYHMDALDQKLTPQKEEDIERTEWMTLEKFFSKKRKVYSNILRLLEKISIVKN